MSALSSALLNPVSAKAQEALPVRIVYTNDGTCPDRTSFTRELLARTPELRLAEGQEDALEVTVELSRRTAHGTDAQAEQSISGRMVAKEDSGRETVREVAGNTCEEVSAALALIAAVLVEPGTEHEPPRLSDGYPLPQALPEEKPAAQRDWDVRAGLGVGFDSAWAPSPMAGASAAVEFESQHSGSPQPLIVFVVNYARTPLDDTSEYEWIVLRAGVCPFRWPTNRALYLTVCPFADVGRLRGRSTVTSATIPWVAVGTYGRIEAKALNVLTFSLDSGLVIPVNRHQFIEKGGLDDAEYEIPFIGLLGRLGVSATF